MRVSNFPFSCFFSPQFYPRFTLNTLITISSFSIGALMGHIKRDLNVNKVNKYSACNSACEVAWSTHVFVFCSVRRIS